MCINKVICKAQANNWTTPRTTLLSRRKELPCTISSIYSTLIQLQCFIQTTNLFLISYSWTDPASLIIMCIQTIKLDGTLGQYRLSQAKHIMQETVTPLQPSPSRCKRNPSLEVKIVAFIDSIPSNTSVAAVEKCWGHFNAVWPAAEEDSSWCRDLSVRIQFWQS